ncbi:MAG: hypothetical protein U1F57_11690 [bacterium]
MNLEQLHQLLRSCLEFQGETLRYSGQLEESGSSVSEWLVDGTAPLYEEAQGEFANSQQLLSEGFQLIQQGQGERAALFELSSSFHLYRSRQSLDHYRAQIRQGTQGYRDLAFIGGSTGAAGTIGAGIGSLAAGPAGMGALGLSLALHGLVFSVAEVESRPTVYPPLPSSEEALLDQAQGVLERWLQGEDTFVDGDFFQNWENLHCQPALSLAERSMLYPASVYFDRHLGALRDQGGNPGERAERAVRQLYLYGGLDRYRRDFPFFGNFLKGDGGNCVAETLLILQAVRYLGIQFQRPEVLALEVFDDHVQAVVYNTETRETWALLSGESLPEPKGDIYAPQVILQGPLAASERVPPATSLAFLIAEGAGPRTALPVSESLRISSGLWAFPHTGIRFHDGEIPEETILPPPRPRYFPLASENQEPDSNSLEDLSGRQRFLVEKSMQWLNRDIGFEAPITFRLRPQSVFYNHLPNEQREDYSFSFYRRATFEDSDFPALLTVLNNPTNFLSLPREGQAGIGGLSSALRIYANSLNLFNDSLSVRFRNYFESRAQAHDINSRLQRFATWAEAHPDMAIELANRSDGHFAQPLLALVHMSEQRRNLPLGQTSASLQARLLALPILPQDSSEITAGALQPSIMTGTRFEIEMVARPLSVATSLSPRAFFGFAMFCLKEGLILNRDPFGQRLLARWNSQVSRQLLQLQDPALEREWLDFIRFYRDAGVSQRLPRAMKAEERELLRRAAARGN